jgi:hypothetical protein
MEAADPEGGERVVRGREALVVGGQRGAAASYGAPEREVLRHGEGARGKWMTGAWRSAPRGRRRVERPTSLRGGEPTKYKRTPSWYRVSLIAGYTGNIAVRLYPVH